MIDFPYETVVAADAVAGLHLQRDGSGPLPVAFYQRWFETQPSAKDDGFHLITQLTDARGRPLHQLTLGTTAYLKVTVVSQADAEYVMVEVPIPAGCSYADRNEAREGGPFTANTSATGWPSSATGCRRDRIRSGWRWLRVFPGRTRLTPRGRKCNICRWLMETGSWRW